MAEKIETWQQLKCDSCNSPRIVQLLTLSWKPGGGSNPQPGGYACWDCRAILSVERLILMGEIEKQKVEIAATQAKLEADQAALKKEK